MDINEQRCPNCAGKLQSDFENMKKECPFCGAVFAITENTESYNNTTSERSINSEVEKSEYNVRLIHVGPYKVKAIKSLRELTGLGLKEAKDLIDVEPNTLLRGVDKSTAERFCEKMNQDVPGIELEVE